METAADIEYFAGRVEQADGLYEQVAGLLFDEARLRTLDVKRWARQGLAHDAVAALLIGDAELGASWDVAAPLLGSLKEQQPDQGIASYLIGRNLMLRGRNVEAAANLDDALARPIALFRVRREALRDRLLVGCALAERERAGQVLTDLLADAELTESQRNGLLRLAERCALSAH
jgi:hypothetical protein